MRKYRFSFHTNIQIFLIAILCVIISYLYDLKIPVNKTNDLEEKGPVKSDELIGVWHAASSGDSVNDDMYFFYSDNRFKLLYNQNDEKSETISASGKWSLEAETLILTVDEKIVKSGEPESYYLYANISERYQKKELARPEDIIHTVERVKNDKDSPYKHKLKISEKNFWKLSDNPDDKYYKKLVNTIENDSVNTISLKKYSNKRYNFSINYPTSWGIYESHYQQGALLYNKDGNEISFFGGYIFEKDAESKEIEKLMDKGFELEDFTTSEGKKGYKLILRKGDRVTLVIVLYGKNTHCRLFADVSYTFFQTNEELLIDLAKSIEITK